MSALTYSEISGKEVAKWCLLHQGVPATAWLSHWIKFITPDQRLRLYQFDEGVLFGEEVDGHLNLHGLIENPSKVLAQFQQGAVTCWLGEEATLSGWKQQSMILMKAAPLAKTEFSAQGPHLGWQLELLKKHPDFADTYRSRLHEPSRGGRLHALYSASGELIHLQLWEEQAELYVGHYVWSQLKGIMLWQEFLKVQAVGKRRASWVSPANEASVKLHLACGYEKSSVTIWGYTRN